jgi:hypothetical protein
MNSTSIVAATPWLTLPITIGLLVREEKGEPDIRQMFPRLVTHTE